MRHRFLRKGFIDVRRLSKYLTADAFQVDLTFKLFLYSSLQFMIVISFIAQMCTEKKALNINYHSMHSTATLTYIDNEKGENEEKTNSHLCNEIRCKKNFVRFVM